MRCESSIRSSSVITVRQQVRDFVAFWGRNFAISDICDYIGAEEHTVRVYIKQLVDEGVVKKLKYGGLYVVKKETAKEVKDRELKYRKFRDEKVKSLEQAKEYRIQLLKQKANLEVQLAWIDGFVGEMEAICRN